MQNAKKGLGETVMQPRPPHRSFSNLKLIVDLFKLLKELCWLYYFNFFLRTNGQFDAGINGRRHEDMVTES